MDIAELLVEMYGRVPEEIHGAVDGLSADELTARPAPGANSIAWLVWHLTRVQDEHVAELIGVEQLWVEEPWPEQFGLPADPHDTGYGHTTEQVAAVRPDGPDVLVEYYGAVAARTTAWLATLTPDDLDRIVDERWDPPVTLGVRLVSIVDDHIQHAGQAAYVRGLLPPR
ncbi:MAG: DUF664 domain-containing protein [Ilumatobacteraceae bacterium]